MKRLFSTLLVLAAIAGPADAGAAATVAVIMSADVDAYQEALKGFRETLEGTPGHRIVAEYDMRGDFGRGRKIVAEIRSKVKPDIILAVGLWALQVTLERPSDLPVIYAMILNPPSILEDGVSNATGASMNVSVEQSIILFKQLGPQIQRIGVLFTPANTGYLVRQAKVVAQREGLELVAKEIGSPREAIQAVNALQQEGIDALWILPDEAVLDPKVLKYTLLFSYRQKVPLLGLSERQAQMGALMAISFASSKDIGRQAGELATGVLQGKPATQIPFTTARRVNLTVNLKAARALGMQIPESIVARASSVIR